MDSFISTCINSIERHCALIIGYALFIIGVSNEQAQTGIRQNFQTPPNAAKNPMATTGRWIIWETRAKCPVRANTGGFFVERLKTRE